MAVERREITVVNDLRKVGGEILDGRTQRLSDIITRVIKASPITGGAGVNFIVKFLSQERPTAEDWDHACLGAELVSSGCGDKIPKDAASLWTVIFAHRERTKK